MKRIEKMNEILATLADDVHSLSRDPKIMTDDVLRYDVREIRSAIERIEDALDDLESALTPIQPEIAEFQSSLGPLLQAGERCFSCHRVLPEGGPYSGCPYCGKSFVG